jgi:outer membrane protein
MRNATRSGRQWRNRLAISFFFCVGLVPAVGAQEPTGQLPAATTLQPSQQTPWTLADCVRIGFERQPTLAAQRASVAAAEAQRVALDRMVCVSLLSREMGYRKQQACLGVTIAQAGVEIAEWETVYAVTRCYYTLVYARRQEIVAKGLLEKLELARNNAQTLVKKGDPDSVVTQVDVDKLAVNIDLLQLRLIEASTGVNRAWAALREAIGVRYDTPRPLALEDLPPLGDVPPAETLVQMALSRRGEIVQAGCAANLAELEVCAQNTGCLLPFKNNFAAAADVHSRPIPQGSNDVNYRPAAIGLEMPTTLVGRKADRVARAQDLSNRAGAVVEKTQGLVALETEDTYGKWQAAASQVKTLRESAPKSAKLAEVISGRFDNGKVSAEDYLRARTLEDQTQSQLNEALFQHALALAALERVTAGGYTPSFRRP